MSVNGIGRGLQRSDGFLECHDSLWVFREAADGLGQRVRIAGDEMHTVQAIAYFFSHAANV